MTKQKEQCGNVIAKYDLETKDVPISTARYRNKKLKEKAIAGYKTERFKNGA